MKITLHPATLPVAALAALLGKSAPLAGLAVALHEGAHVAAAHCLGLATEEFALLPLGARARIPRLDQAAPAARALVALAGPAMNCYLAAACAQTRGAFFWANLAIGAVNLLPAPPLDGGRMARQLLGNRLGIRRADRVLATCAKITGGLLVAAGLVQGIIRPFHVSLGLLGGYLLWYPSVRQAHEFFRAITEPSRQQLPRRAVAAPAGLPLLAALDKLTWDTRCQFRLPNRRVVEEAALVAHLLAHGPGGTLEDVVRLQSSSCLSKK